LGKHLWERHWIDKNKAFTQIEALVKKGFDVFINLCDGAADQTDIAGIEVVEALSFFGVAYTGAATNFYDPTRQEMKQACQKAGLKYPRGISINKIAELETSCKNLRFPLIVKHPHSYNSIGLTKKSKVFNFNELVIITQQFIHQFGAVLIEEFIVGREFTVLVAENSIAKAPPIAFPPVEFVFPPDEDFKHFDLKWKTYDQMQCLPCENIELASLLQSQTSLFFEALNGSGYGRADIRVTEAGEVYFLEMNPNCSIYYDLQQAGSADFILLQLPNGHQQFTDLLLQSAFHRVKR
jgi:D-alanine-D-alanine ligase